MYRIRLNNFLLPLFLMLHSVSCSGSESQSGHLLDLISDQEIKVFCEKSDFKLVEHLDTSWVLSDELVKGDSDKFSTLYISREELKGDGYISVLNFEKRIRDYEMYVIPKKSALKEIPLSSKDSRKIYMLPPLTQQADNNSAYTTYSWLIEVEGGLLNVNSTDEIDVLYGLGAREFERVCGRKPHSEKGQ